MKLLKRIFLNNITSRTIINKRGFITKFLQMSIQTVVAKIHLSVFIPSVSWNLDFDSVVIKAEWGLIDTEYCGGESFPINKTCLILPELDSI